MLRILLIIVLVVYALYKLGLFRVFVINAKQGYDPQKVNHKPTDSNVNIDNAPPRPKGGSDYKGGEYVDYEDVKE
jgi:hypothetical protein